MDVNLALRLLEMRVIRPGIEIDAYYRTHDLSGSCRATVPGNFMVLGARLSHGTVYFNAASTEAGKRVWVRAEDITRLDGMTPVRVAEIYHLTETGQPANVRRRTRKPRGAEV